MSRVPPPPEDFNWKHYRTLNPFVGVPNDETGAAEHYGSWGRTYGWACDYAALQVLVYSAGKSGSSTLGTSFIRSGYRTALLHYDPPDPASGSIADIISYPRSHKLLVVTAYREPVSRYISAFFQNITPLLKMSQEEFADQDYDWCVSKVIEHLRNVIAKPSNENLFDESLRANYDGVDILAAPFDKDQGYTFIETDKIQIFVTRFDKMDNWGQLINTHTGKSVRITATNLTDKKPIGLLYKQISSNIKVPREILDHLYVIEAPTIEHLFTSAEIDAIISKWYDRLADE